MLLENCVCLCVMFQSKKRPLGKRIFFLILLSITLFSCEQFDSDKPDTDNNKERFKEYVEIELTGDINDIYTYGDLGPDYSVIISFSCDSTTVERIIKKKNLKLSHQDHDTGLFFLEEFPWWDKGLIDKIRPYQNIKKSKLSQYLWYDKKNNNAYYEELGF